MFGLAPRAEAFSRVYRPIGDYLRESPLVIMADISTRQTPQFETVFTVREILKNRAQTPVAVGQTLAFAAGRTRWIVPPDARGAIVVMAPNWDLPATHAPRPISEVYRTPAQIAAVRALVPVYENSGERARLLALQALAGQGNRFLDEQLLADVGRMRERDNLSIALESFDRLETEDQARLLGLLGTIGDARAVPLLIRALDAPDKSVWASAVRQLSLGFANAPAANAALRKTAR